MNPVVVKDEALRRNAETALKETLRPTNPNIPLQRSIYKGIKELFDALRDMDPSQQQAVSGEEVSNDLKAHLCRPDAGSEAVRLLRADAIASVTRYSSSLAAALRSDVLALIQEERSSNVRDRLSSAIGV